MKLFGKKNKKIKIQQYPPLPIAASGISIFNSNSTFYGSGIVDIKPELEVKTMMDILSLSKKQLETHTIILVDENGNRTVR